MSMKQLATLILTVLLFIPLSVSAAGAATMGFTETAITLNAGATADLTISIDPRGEDLDTVRSVFTFDPTVLKIENVVKVGPFDRNTPGNFIDNKNGEVSWGAFTLEGPITTAGPYLRVTVLAKQEGKAKIELTKQSKLISDGEEKINTGKLGSVNVSVEPEGQADTSLSLITVSSASHPESSSWYAKADVEVEWVELKGESEIEAYSYAFDQSSDTDPAIYADPATTSQTFEGVKDGIHYFHIKGIQKDGKTTKTTHRRIQVDTTNPNPVAVTVSEDQLLEGESLWLTFATTDETSGVEQYKLSINTSEFLPQESPLELTDLVPGTYFLRVAAVDRAGNITYQGKSVRVYPEGTELTRPEGFDPTSEITALSSPSSQLPVTRYQLPKLLITLVLLVVVVFGIIYAIKKKKI